MDTPAKRFHKGTGLINTATHCCPDISCTVAIAAATSSAVHVTPSFRHKLFRWFPTVSGLMSSATDISFEDWARAISRKTSISRRVSSVMSAVNNKTNNRNIVQAIVFMSSRRILITV